MAYTITPLAGIDLNDTQTVAEQALQSGLVTFGPLGAEVFTSAGKRAVWAVAGSAITASTTTCAINASTFVATGAAGTYTSPAVAMASGDYGWFSAASV
jgi:hypothetical protein